jgi:hypothetical protein
MPLSIHSTADVSLATLEEFNAELPSEIRGEVASSQIFLRSADPPSWVTFLADADWWIKALAAWGALYAAEITKEAGKDSWRNRGRLLAAGRRLGVGMTSAFARSISTLADRLHARTSLRIGVPVPDDYFSTTLQLDGHNPHDVALDLVAFVLHLPALMKLIDGQKLQDNAASGVLLVIKDDMSMEVSWADAQTLRPERVVLRLPDPAV